MCKKIIALGNVKFYKMENTQTITALNKLIDLHNDRSDGYETTSRVADEPDLKTLFAQLARIRKKCRQELAFEISRLGGIPREVIPISDRFFNAWLEVNDMLADNDREDLLNYCENREGEAIGIYKAVLEDYAGILSLEQKI